MGGFTITRRGFQSEETGVGGRPAGSVASGDSAYTQGAKLDIGPVTPNPPAGTGEYVWIKTDGNGTLIDIVTGKV